MAKLTKEQINELAEKVDRGWLGNQVHLMCDGYKITLQQERYKRQIRVGLYVNGKFCGKWFVNDGHEELKFFKDAKFSKKKLAVLKEMGLSLPNFKKPDFASGKDALRHLNKVCENIEVV